jgi:hypothetical protein
VLGFFNSKLLFAAELFPFFRMDVCHHKCVGVTLLPAAASTWKLFPNSLDQIKQAGASYTSDWLFMAFRYFVGLAGEKSFIPLTWANPNQASGLIKFNCCRTTWQAGDTAASQCPCHGNWAHSLWKNADGEVAVFLSLFYLPTGLSSHLPGVPVGGGFSRLPPCPFLVSLLSLAPWAAWR